MSDKINGPSAYLSALSEAPREDLLSEVCRQKARAETAEARVKELEGRLSRMCGCGWVGDKEYHECADHAALRQQRDEARAKLEEVRGATRGNLSGAVQMIYNMLERASKRYDQPVLLEAAKDLKAASNEMLTEDHVSWVKCPYCKEEYSPVDEPCFTHALARVKKLEARLERVRGYCGEPNNGLYQEGRRWADDIMTIITADEADCLPVEECSE